MVLIVADLKVYINSSKFNVALAKFVYMDRLTFPLNVFEMPSTHRILFLDMVVAQIRRIPRSSQSSMIESNYLFVDLPVDSL